MALLLAYRLCLAITAAALCCAAAPHVWHLNDAVTRAITTERIQAHLRFLSDPLLEGRFAGSRGESLAANYIAAQLAANNVLPANGSSYFQAVPLTAVAPVVKGDLVLSGASGSLALHHGAEYVGSTQMRSTNVTLDGDDVVFVGYGINDAAHGWDDYKGVDLTGKIALVVLAQPTTGVWNSKPMTWAGRYNYKIEEAAKRGAKGVLFINIPSRTGYSWTAMQGAQGGSVVQSPSSLPANPVAFYAWVEQGAADQAAHLCGTNLSSLLIAAESPSFTPMILPFQASLRSTFKFSDFAGKSVVGIIPGRSRPHEAVVMSGHIDHIGTQNGTVYPGALDNAAGAAIVLAAAIALGQRTACGMVTNERSILFFFPTAEEWGLYGAKHLIRNPLGLRIIANVNFDIGNGWGRTRDLIVVGRNTMTTDIVPKVFSKEGLIMTPDPVPQMGFLYRSDSFAFEQSGIPSIWVLQGTMYYGKPADYFSTVVTNYLMPPPLGRYHQPTDTFENIASFEGMEQQGRAGLRVIYAIADSRTYYPANSGITSL